MPLYKNKITGKVQEFEEDQGNFWVEHGFVKVKDESEAETAARLRKEAEALKVEVTDDVVEAEVARKQPQHTKRKDDK
jgi:regulator of replication initiation timing